jgi:LAO/AO transport system kinase
MDLTAKDLLNGDRRTLAKLITEVENGSPKARRILRQIYGKTGKAVVVGFTGPLGVGKSSLINKLLQHLRAKGKKVGVIAIDPSSPFSGGAVLGDRVRLERPEGDMTSFVRSMATRGHVGGVAQGTRDVIRLMEAFGMDVVIVETVGSGQADVDIRDIATTRVVVLVPHLGDDVQSLKAGLFEIADVFVVNKSDLAGASEAARHLKEMVTIMAPRDGWKPMVVESSTLDSSGVDELWTAVSRHEVSMKMSHLFEKEARERLEKEVRELAREHVEARLGRLVERDAEGKIIVEQVINGKTDPYTGSERLVARLTKEKIG